MQCAEIDLGVDQRAVQVAMPEQVGDVFETVPLFEQTRSQAVPKEMRAARGFFGQDDAGFAQAFGDDAGERTRVT